MTTNQANQATTAMLAALTGAQRDLSALYVAGDVEPAEYHAGIAAIHAEMSAARECGPCSCLSCLSCRAAEAGR